MDITVNTDTLMEKLAARMELNVKANAQAQGMSEEEINATLVLNRKKIADDAKKLHDFFLSVYNEGSEQTAE